MPSEPHEFGELKLPFIFVPQGAPEPTEWLASRPDHIKLPATFVPRARSDGRADSSSGGPPPGQRRTIDGPAAPPDPAAPSPPTGHTMPNAMQAATNDAPDRASLSDDPIAAYLQANDAFATAASGYVSGRGAAPDAPAGPVVASDSPNADSTHTDARQAEDPTAPAALGAGPHPYVARNPRQWIGHEQVGNGECVALVEKATGAPLDKSWRKGALVQGNTQLAPGTAIAVFDSNGRYGNHTDGTSHAAIYLRQDAKGIYVIEQWNVRVDGRVVSHWGPAEKLIPFNRPDRNPIGRGESYHAIE